jgi:beta-galactosidase GanA
MMTLRVCSVTVVLIACVSGSQSFAADAIDLDPANPDVWAEKSFDLAGDPVDGAFCGSARHLTEPGSYIAKASSWQRWEAFDDSLYPGTYRAFARIKGSGVFRVTIRDSSTNTDREVFEPLTVNTDTLTLFELGQFEYNRDYQVIFTDASSGGLWVDYIAVRGVSAMTPAIAAIRAQSIRDEAAKLKTLLDKAQERGLDVAEQEAVHGVATLYCDYGIDDVGRGKLIRGEHVFDYLDKSVPRAMAEVEGILTAGVPKARPPVDVQDLQLKRGHFYSGDAPVYLTGLFWAPAGALVSLGMNYDYWPRDFWGQMPDPLNGVMDASYHGDTLRRLRAARAAGLVSTICLHTHYKFGFLKAFPDTRYVKPAQGPGKHAPYFETGYCHDSPISRKAYENVVKTAVTALETAGLWNMELMNEPGYACQCSYTLNKFRYYLKQEYTTIDKLNEAWGNQYGNFDDVQFVDLKTARQASTYDWLDFNQRRFRDMIAWRNKTINQQAPGLLTEVKIISRRVFPMGNHDVTWGIDHEAIAQTSPMVGHDGGTWGITRAMDYDLYRSLALGRPILDNESHPGEIQELANFNMWNGAIHGEAGLAVWVWHRGETAGNLKMLHDFIATKPRQAESVARTHQQLNRLMVDLVPMTEVQPEVSILFSRAARLMDIDVHMKEVMEVYPSLLFSGAHVGFITERRLTGRQFGKNKVIIVPQVNYFPAEALAGLADFANAGGTIVFVGKSQFKTERGAPGNSDLVQQLAIEAGQKRTLGKGRLIGIASGLGQDKKFQVAEEGPDLPVKIEKGKDKLAGLAATENWDVYQDPLSKVLDDVKIDRCPGYARGVEARRCVNDAGQELRVYLNYSESRAAVIDVPAGSVELITRKKCADQITVQPLGVALVRIQ